MALIDPNTGEPMETPQYSISPEDLDASGSVVISGDASVVVDYLDGISTKLENIDTALTKLLNIAQRT